MCLIWGPARWEDGGFRTTGFGVRRLGRKSPRGVGWEVRVPCWAGPGGLESVMSRWGGFVLEVLVSFRRLKIKASGSQ